MLQLKADHLQVSKLLLTDFRKIGVYIIEDAPTYHNYLVRKIETNKTQVLHRMELLPFTPKESISNVKTTSPRSKPDPDVIIKLDHMYARA